MHFLGHIPLTALSINNKPSYIYRLFTIYYLLLTINYYRLFLLAAFAISRTLIF